MAPSHDLVRESLELALLRDDDFPRRFYEILFQRHPETRSLFVSNSLNVQRQMVAQTLMAAVDRYDDEAWLSTTLEPLGANHLRYGVTPQMYDWAGEALIDAVAEVCAESFSPAHRAAWTVAYARITGIMRRGERIQ